MALRYFVEEYDEEDMGALRPVIPQLLSEIFKLMGEVRPGLRPLLQAKHVSLLGRISLIIK